MTKVITKVPAGLQDILPGIGTTTQTRGNQTVTVNGLGLTVTVADLDGLRALPTTVPFALVGDGTNQIKYIYNSSSTAVVDNDHVVLPNSLVGRWLKVSDTDVVFATEADVRKAPLEVGVSARTLGQDTVADGFARTFVIVAASETGYMTLDNGNKAVITSTGYTVAEVNDLLDTKLTIGTDPDEGRTNAENDALFLAAGTGGSQGRTNDENDARFLQTANLLSEFDDEDKKDVAKENLGVVGGYKGIYQTRANTVDPTGTGSTDGDLACTDDYLYYVDDRELLYAFTRSTAGLGNPWALEDSIAISGSQHRVTVMPSGAILVFNWATNIRSYSFNGTTLSTLSSSYNVTGDTNQFGSIVARNDTQFATYSTSTDVLSIYSYVSDTIAFVEDTTVPDEVVLQKFFFVDDNTAVIGGSSGVFLLTLSGTTWSIIDTFDVAFASMLFQIDAKNFGLYYNGPNTSDPVILLTVQNNKLVVSAVSNIELFIADPVIANTAGEVFAMDGGTTPELMYLRAV